MLAINYSLWAIMFLSIVVGFATGLWFLFRPSDNPKANRCFGSLLFLFALSSINVLLLRRPDNDYIHLYHAPLWYTLSFGPLLFYYVKFSLFPSYQFRRTDSKHFIFPIVQFGFTAFMSTQTTEQQQSIYEHFILPIYSPLEYSAFLVTLLLYLSVSYRYIRYKLVRLRHEAKIKDVQQATALRWLIKVFVILASSYSFFAFSDFIAYNFFNINLQQVPIFTHTGDLIFATMLFWLCYQGIKKRISMSI